MTAVAGYVGPLEAWKPVELQWKENLSLWRLGEFRLADIPQQLGHERGALCVGTFARILKISELHAVGAALNDLDWRDSEDAAHGDTYITCFGMLIHLLREHLRLEFPDDHAVIVVDRDMADEDKIKAIYAWHASNTDQLRGITIGDRRTFRAIECADLAAGYLRKEWMEEEFGSQLFRDYFAAPRGRLVVWSKKQWEKAQEAIRQRNRKTD
jgi:hypothetical protein